MPALYTVQWNPDPANSQRTPRPNFSLHVSHRIYANLRIESAPVGGGSCPHLPPSVATLM